jgi:hypothetical protein
MGSNGCPHESAGLAIVQRELIVTLAARHKFPAIAAPEMDIRFEMDIRLWHLADIPDRRSMSAFGGKADIPFCAANVC